MYSIIIKNARLIDGSGSPEVLLDIAVSGDKIVSIEKNISSPAETIIDASGKIVTPGFIDIQNHSDAYWQIFDNPFLDSMVMQGFTTIVIGNCGASLAPLLSHDALKSIQKWHSLEGANINWQSFSEYMEDLSKRRFGCNLASLVGYSTIRRGIVGDRVRILDKQEMKMMQNALEDSLEAGAFGMSSGLSYAHEVIISELELFELAKIIKKHDALFSIHLRNESSEILESIDEVLDIAKNSEVRTKISHLKVRNENNWPLFPEILQKLETAVHQGINVSFDCYPYDTIWQVMYSYLPKWAMQGGRAQFISMLSDNFQKNKILMHLNNLNIKFSSLFVSSTTNKLNFAGKTVGQIAKNLGVSSEQAVLHIIQNGGSEILVFEKNLNSEQVGNFCAHPLSVVSTDGGGFSLDQNDKLVHPRCFGTSAKFISNVLENKHIPLEDAIHKLSGKPASILGLKKRGMLKTGNFADLVVFDPNKIKDNSSYENPYIFPTGIEYVFVNGKPAVYENAPTEQKSGYVLRKNQ